MKGCRSKILLLLAAAACAQAPRPSERASVTVATPSVAESAVEIIEAPAIPGPLTAISAEMLPPEASEGAEAAAINPAAWAAAIPAAEVGRDFKAIYFDFDSADLRYDARGELSDYAEWLAGRRDVLLTLEGHCDSSGSAEYNYSLGMARAQAIRAHLAGLGVDKGRMFAISYGEDRPAAIEEGEEAMALNRRVEFRAFIAGTGVAAPGPEPREAPPEPAPPTAPPESSEMP